MSLFDRKPQPKESDLQSDVIDFAEMRGWFCEKIVSQSRNGIMDLVAIRHGRHVWIEVKREGESARPIQERRARQMRSHGAEVYLVDSIEQARQILK